MANKTELKARLEFRKSALSKARQAYLDLLEGRVKSYTIDDRSLTRFDLDELQETILQWEKEVDELEAALNGSGKRRRAYGVVPRDF